MNQKKSPSPIWANLKPPTVNNKTYEWLMDKLKKKYEALYDGIKDISLSKQQLRKIERDLVKYLEHQDAKRTLNYLRIVFQYGKIHLGWDVPDPGYLVDIKYPPPLLTTQNFFDGKEHAILQRVFLKHIDVADSLQDKAIQIVLSAVLFGAYQNKPIELLKNIDITYFSNIPTVIDASSGRVFWHPDPMTEALIWKLKVAEKSFIKSWAERKHVISTGFRCFKRKIGLAQTEIDWPKTYCDLLSICSYLNKIYIPSFLVSDEANNATSLSTLTWKRITTGCRSNQAPELGQNHHANTVPASEQASTSSPKSLPRQSSVSAINLELEITHLRDARRLLKRYKEQRVSKTDMVQNFTRKSVSAKNNHSCIAYIIISWFADMAETKESSTIQTRASAIIRPLLRVLSVLEIDFPPLSEDWTGIFDEIVFMEKQNNRKEMIGTLAALRSFQKFLVREHHLDELDCGDIPFMTSKTKQADANLITHNEMDCLFQVYNTIGLTRRTLMEQVAASLGFYCGLRASEVLNLRLADVFDIDSLGFNVQKHHFGNPKSSHSSRKVPVASLLPPSQQKQFKRLVELRMLESLENFNLLVFSSTENARYSQETILGPIMDKLRKITGDKSLRFHHLRHSFANWTLIRLLSVHQPKIINHDIAAFKHSAFKPEACKLLSSALLSDGYDRQSALYCVRERLGHADESTTLASYFHLSKYLQNIYGRNYIPELKPPQIRSLLGFSNGGFYKLQKRIVGNPKNIESYLNYLIERKNKVDHSDKNTLIDEQSHLPEIEQNFLPDWVRSLLPISIDKFLELIRSNQYSLEELGKMFLVPEDKIRAWATSSEIILEHNKRRHKLSRPLSLNFPRPAFAREDSLRSLQRMGNPSEQIAGLIEAALDMYWEHGTAKNFQVYLDTPQAVILFTRFVKYLGVPSSKIILRFIPPKSMKGKSINTMMNLWATQSLIPRCQIRMNRRSRSTSNANGAVYFSLVDWRKPQKTNSSRKTPRGIGEGIHFAIEVQLRLRLLLKSSQDRE